MAAEILTDRLRLRHWEPRDREPFAALNADPIVMEYFPSTLSHTESDAFVCRIRAHFDTHAFGLWAVELRATGQFVGFTGLWHATLDAPFAPAVEVGWRLSQPFWGLGTAPEAAHAAMSDGFERLHLTEIVSFTSKINIKSQRVMEKLEMTYDSGDDFDHPAVPSGHPLRRHVLYRLPRQ